METKYKDEIRDRLVSWKKLNFNKYNFQFGQVYTDGQPENRDWIKLENKNKFKSDYKH